MEKYLSNYETAYWLDRREQWKEIIRKYRIRQRAIMIVKMRQDLEMDTKPAPIPPYNPPKMPYKRPFAWLSYLLP